MEIATKKECLRHASPSVFLPEQRSLQFHLYTIWLITRNDLKSILLPETAFGIFSALSGPSITTNPSPTPSYILSRLPQVVLWNWLNLLIFDIANQRLPSSILEDSINKPWRPIPSGRLTPVQARHLLLTILGPITLVTYFLGGMEETVAMMVLTWMYNDLAGADEHYIIRNLINAAGFICYSSGSTRVACNYGFTLNSVAYLWLAIVGGVVFSTLQMQDMADQVGDHARDRKTAPLVLGDGPARWTIAIPVLVWSFVCPLFWRVSMYWYLPPVGWGGLLAGRVLLLKSVEADKVTWKIWCYWTMLLYLLPLVGYRHLVIVS